MQAAVDGLIESVGHPFEDEFSIFVNEEGKFRDHFLNTVATKMFGQWLSSLDYFAGDVLVMGPVDSQGETLGLDPSKIDKLMAMRRAALR
jgi:hypothetical protein